MEADEFGAFSSASQDQGNNCRCVLFVLSPLAMIIVRGTTFCHGYSNVTRQVVVFTPVTCRHVCTGSPFGASLATVLGI